MIDSESFAKMVPDHPSHVPHERSRLKGVRDEELYLCAPTVLGYSFGNKLWGRFTADKFEDIDWGEPLLDHLVLSEPKKQLLQSLISADQSVDLVSDVIPSKAGGFVVILYGKPGTGKTLTAEAAAELRKCPLMTVSAAELGYKLGEMESKFRDILQICEAWKGILLIDEAEVYLETRKPGNIEQNGMVSVFLRLLEYHQLLIFLTTNHIDRLDPAVKSRISVAIKYPDLDDRARAGIWKRFLSRADVEIVDDDASVDGAEMITQRELRALGKKDLNGRYYLFERRLMKANKECSKNSTGCCETDK